MSASSDTVAERILAVLGVVGDERFSSFADRMEHREELEALMVEWCATRDSAEAVRTLTEADAAVGRVMDMADIAADEHFLHRGVVTEVDGTPMQSLIARLSATPGELRWAGRPLDADGAAIRADGWGRPSPSA